MGAANSSDKTGAIIAAITAAFAGVGRGEGISMHEADAIDSYRSDAECRQARALDTEAHWQDLSSEKIEQFHCVLIYTNAEGFRYYIPAFMIQALRDWQTGSLATDIAVSSLFPIHAEQEKKYMLLNDAQKKCIAQFLWFMATETNGQWSDKLKAYNATRALEDVWYPHLEEGKKP